VLSPGWINFCSDSTVSIKACIERHWGVLKDFAKIDLPVSQKLQVLFSRYLTQSSIVPAIVNAFGFAFTVKVSRLGHFNISIDMGVPS
jgi:hypothetical protein